MKYILSPLFIFSIYLLVSVDWLAMAGHRADGSIIMIPFILIGSLCGFTAHHLIFGLHVRFGVAIILELLMILLLLLAGYCLGFYN